MQMKQLASYCIQYTIHNTVQYEYEYCLTIIMYEYSSYYPWTGGIVHVQLSRLLSKWK